MKLAEYAANDATGLADLVAKGEVSPKELARTVLAAIGAVNGDLANFGEPDLTPD